MPRQRANESIRAWQEGDSVSGFALLGKKERRQDRNGRDFVDLRLSDASGSIDGKIWSDSPALNGDFEAHDFVAFEGVVKSYRDRLQLTVKSCRKVDEQDRKRGFDESLLIPTTRASVDELWKRLQDLFEGEVNDPYLRRLALETLTTYGPALREHPAAKAMHHAYRGGLLEHVVSMAELALVVCRHYPELRNDLVLVGVLFHDLGKIIEIGAMPVNEYTMEGRLVGHVVMGRDLLRERCDAIDGFPADLKLHLEHLVLSHQGRLDFGSPVEPMTAEAIVLHTIDNLDAKLAQLREAAREGTGFQYLRGLDRYIFLSPDSTSENDNRSEDEDSPEQLELT